MSESNAVGTPVTLRGSKYSKPSMGTTEVGAGDKTSASTQVRDKNKLSYKEPAKKHLVVGEAPSEPKTEATVVHQSARHNEGTEAIVEAGTRTNSKNPEKEYIPIHGGSTETRGYKYPEDPRGHQTAKEDVGVVRRCIDAQISSSTPIAVPDSKKNKS